MAIVNLGKAAHITAAAAGGPRFNPTLTPEQRSSETNGIWLCAIHADQIDRDEEHFTVETLHEWKQKAIERAFLELEPNRALLETGDADLERIAGLGLPLTDDLASVVETIRNAAQRDLRGFKSLPGWPMHPVLLAFREFEFAEGVRIGAKPIEMPAIAAAVNRWEPVAIVSPPGTGKTTTLVQLAEALLSDHEVIPFVVPLSEWAQQADSLLTYLSKRASLRGVREEHLVLLALHGRLALLLDGWNELDPAASLRCATEIKRIKREFPLLGIAITTRRQALGVPIASRRLEIQELSEDQQLEIAKAIRGDDGEKLLDRMQRTPGVRDLVSIPLYFTALLTIDTQLPATKEEVLRLFVQQHEQSSEKSQTFRYELQNLHDEYLGDLAAVATGSANTAILGATASVSVKGTQSRHAAQIGTPPDPLKVLDILVSHHVLVRSDDGRGTYAFQHQQIAEWYSSLKAAQVMLASASGDADAQAELRSQLLNLPAWEESVLFACERMSRSDEGKRSAVGKAILVAVEVDPMLPAEMIYRSAPSVWDDVKAAVVPFVERWHTSSRLDRAVKFMITSGRSEFAGHMWSLLGSADRSAYLGAIRAARRFRPSVLGSDEDAFARLAALPEAQRGDVASEIVDNGGAEGIDFILKYVERENEPAVLVEIIDSLVLRRATTAAKKLLDVAPDEVWELVAKGAAVEDIPDVQVRERIAVERQKLRSRETDPLRKLSLLAEDGTGGNGNIIVEVIADPNLDTRAENAPRVFAEAAKKSPEAVAQGLIRRLEANLPLPFHTEQLLEAATLVEEGPLVDAALAKDVEPRPNTAIAMVFGSEATKKLINKFLVQHAALGERPTEAERRARDHTEALILRTRPTQFAEAIATFAGETVPSRIALLSCLIARHGRGGIDNGALPPEVAEGLTRLIPPWVSRIIANASSNRHEMADVCTAIARIRHESLLPAVKELLAEDLKRIAAEDEALRLARAKGQRGPTEARMLYDLQYAEAFVAIGTEEAAKEAAPLLSHPHFGKRAAVIVTRIAMREEDRQDEGKVFRRGWPDFPSIKARRAARLAKETDAHPLVELVLPTILELTNKSDPEPHPRAVELASVALRMPYGHRPDLVQQLLTLDVPWWARRALMLTLVNAGEIVSHELAMSGLKALMEEAKAKPWLLEDNRSDLKEWLEILAFSDFPESVLDALDLIDGRVLQPWRLRFLFHALAHAPEKAEAVLLALPTKIAGVVDQYEWCDALLKVGSDAALAGLFDLLESGVTLNGLEVWHSSPRIAALVKERPSLRREIERRIEKGAKGKALSLYEHILAEEPSLTGIMSAVRRYAAGGRKADGQLRKAVEHLVVERRPSDDIQGAVELVAVPAVEFRKQLFQIFLHGNPAEAAIARDCLLRIDELRDEYGRPGNEPRHPDIGSGDPWPLPLAPNASISEASKED